MSEALEKVSGIERLAIFPLPLVLLPNEILPLHIFEPKYRQMLQDVQLGRNVFGINYFDEQSVFTDRPPVGSIGCAAEVREFETMPDLRSNILTAGVIRYRLLEYVDDGTPYLMANVEFFEDVPGDELQADELADEVFELFERVAKAAFKLSGNRGSLPQIERSDAEPMSFLVAAAFNLDNMLKLRMLEISSTIERLDRLKDILLPASLKMEESVDIYNASKTNGHSKKKIDIP